MSCRRLSRVWLVAIVASFLLVAASAVRLDAGTITGGAVGGPGGTGVPNYFANVSEAALNYTSVDYLDVILLVDSAGYYDLSQAPGLGFVNNSTGVAWSGFKIEILTSDVSAVFTHVNFAPPGNPPAYDYSNKFPFPAWSTTEILFSGGVVNPTASFSPVSAFQTAGAGTVVIRETPIVPEPATWLLAAIGGAAMIGTWRARWRGKR